MPAFTVNQWAIVALVLVAGWLLGLLSRTGGAKWRRAYEEERDRHAARIEAANARIAELERHAPAVGAGTAGSIAAAARGGVDDLTRIRGIDHEGEVRLNDAGIHRFKDLANLSATDEGALEGRLGLAPGTVTREQWREQAALLQAGKTDEHLQRYA